MSRNAEENGSRRGSREALLSNEGGESSTGNTHRERRHSQLSLSDAETLSAAGIGVIHADSLVTRTRSASLLSDGGGEISVDDGCYCGDAHCERRHSQITHSDAETLSAAGIGVFHVDSVIIHTQAVHDETKAAENDSEADAPSVEERRRAPSPPSADTLLRSCSTIGAVGQVAELPLRRYHSEDARFRPGAFVVEGIDPRYGRRGGHRPRSRVGGVHMSSPPALPARTGNFGGSLFAHREIAVEATLVDPGECFLVGDTSELGIPCVVPSGEAGTAWGVREEK